MKNFALIVNRNGIGQGPNLVTRNRPLVRSVMLAVFVLTLLVASASSANALDYGTVNIGESKTLSTGAVCPAGPGESCLPITSVIIQGPNANEFTITSENCSGTTLPGGGGCSINVTFSPQNPAGSKTAAVAVLGSGGPFFLVELNGIAAASTKRFTAEQKQIFLDLARELRALGHAAGQATRGCPLPICGAVRFIGGASSGAAFALKKLAEDPPDPNYTSIFEPEIPAPTPFTTAVGLSAIEVKAFNDLLANQAQIIGYAEAILVSNDRADGALAANDAFWENKQLEASAKYALKLASLLNEQTLLLAKLRNVLETGGFPTFALTLEEVVDFQNFVAANGLPDDFIEILTQLGATSVEIEDIRMSIVADDPAAIVGNFPEMLTRESLIDALQLAAGALIEFASEHLPEDTEPPVITSLAVDKPVLWAPNHKLVDVFVSYNVEDNTQVRDITLNISSNEPSNATGDGNTTSDWEIIDNHNVRVRAERAGGGVGRIYTITITATDFFGNSSTQAVTVTVPANVKGSPSP